MTDGPVIGRTTRESRPSWSEPVGARPGAPNIIVVVTDDLGYSDIGPYGSEVDTPHLDALAMRGVRLTNYHTTPVCSPARAALLTGLNPHRAGFAGVADHDLGFPNTAGQLPADVLTIPAQLRDAGYATFAVGKWHLTRSGLLHDGAPRDGYPLSRGFERFYGSMEGLNNFFHPNRLMRDNSVIEVDDRGDDYYLTDDLTDQAISMIRGLRASGDRPFFLYFCHQAMHGPLGAKPVDLDKYRGRYDAGWDVLRAERFERQLAAGLFPVDTRLPGPEPRERHVVPAWSDLDSEHQQRFARYMEIYAAMVDNVDQNLGRLLSAIDELDELDNTIVVFTSDNGGTTEGGEVGTRSYFSQFLRVPGLPDSWDRDVDLDIDLIGGPRSMCHYPRGWGRVSNTPFRLYKSQAFAGGVRVPFMISWPGAERERVDGIRHQFAYVTDVGPTLCDLAGVPEPDDRWPDHDGTSFSAVLHDDSAPPARLEQYTEYGGERGLYRDGWKILTAHDPGTPYTDAEWELYDVTTDPTETTDVAVEHPELVADLARRWEEVAQRNQVFPLDAGQGYRSVAQRPTDQAMTRLTRIVPGTFTLERYRSSRLISLRSFDVVVDIAEHHADDAGVLLAHGDQGGGYQLHVEDGRLHWVYNAFGVMHRFVGGEMPVGSSRIVLHARAAENFTWTFDVEGPRGELVAPTPPLQMLLFLAPFSGIDVGVCRGGPVDWPLFERHRTFPYSGDLTSVTYQPGDRAPYDPSLLFDLTVSAGRIED